MTSKVIIKLNTYDDYLKKYLTNSGWRLFSFFFIVFIYFFLFICVQTIYLKRSKLRMEKPCDAELTAYLSTKHENTYTEREYGLFPPLFNLGISNYIYIYICVQYYVVETRHERVHSSGAHNHFHLLTDIFFFSNALFIFFYSYVGLALLLCD